TAGPGAACAVTMTGLTGCGFAPRSCAMGCVGSVSKNCRLMAACGPPAASRFWNSDGAAPGALGAGVPGMGAAVVVAGDSVNNVLALIIGYLFRLSLSLGELVALALHAAVFVAPRFVLPSLLQRLHDLRALRGFAPGIEHLLARRARI